MPRPSPKRPHHALLSSRSGMELKGTAQAGWMPPTPIESNIYTPSKYPMNLDFFTAISTGKRQKHLLGSSETSSTAVRRRSTAGLGEQVSLSVSQCQRYHSFMRIAQHLPHTHTAHDHDHSPKSITYNSCGHTYVCINENTNSATQGKNRLKFCSTEDTYSYS